MKGHSSDKKAPIHGSLSHELSFVALTTFYVVLWHVQPAKIISSCPKSKEPKPETVLPLAIQLQRANLAPVVGRQQEPSLVALIEDQRIKGTERGPSV